LLCAFKFPVSVGLDRETPSRQCSTLFYVAKVKIEAKGISTAQLRHGLMARNLDIAVEHNAFHRGCQQNGDIGCKQKLSGKLWQEWKGQVNLMTEKNSLDLAGRHF
jgi:hypothetical protein